MFVARWQIDARFGHKQDVIDIARRWLSEIGSKAGTDKMDVKILTGSIGARAGPEDHQRELAVVGRRAPDAGRCESR